MTSWRVNDIRGAWEVDFKLKTRDEKNWEFLKKGKNGEFPEKKGIFWVKNVSGEQDEIFKGSQKIKSSKQ